jgi:hypothetical protein
MTRQRQRAMVAAGGSLAALAFVLLDPRAALGGWLAAVVFWGAVPIGALALLMMMKLIPGPWRAELMPGAERLVLLLPLAAIAMLPVLLGIGRLYPWVDLSLHGYRGAYLSIGGFELRSVLFFTGMIVLGLLLLTRPVAAVAVSSAGLIGFVLFDTTMIVDWLMSLDPQFHSSGFGLYGLSIQFTVAIAALLLLRLSAGDAGEHTGILGGLLLTILLLWAYFAFMQYFILWSGNLPQGVRWYRARGEGGWASLEYVIAVLDLVPLFLLFFTPIRCGRRWLMALCVVVLLGKALELAWLVLPTMANLGVGVASMVLALAGLGAAMMLGLNAAPWRRWVPS